MSVFTFLDIEAGLEKAVYSKWQPQGKKIVRLLAKAIKKRDSRGIADALDLLDFDKLTKKAAGRVEALMATALIYGASFAGATGKSPSIFFDPQIGLPDHLDSAYQVYMKIHTQVAPQYIRNKASDLAHARMYERDELQKDEYDEELIAALNGAVLGNAKMMTDIAANLTTSRLVSYGFLAEARARKVRKYQLQAVLDERTSKVCRNLHGREFTVETAYQFLDSVLRVDDPIQLKAMAPFVKSDKASLAELESLSDQELEARGIMVPPFHPGCRTLLVMVGEAQETITETKPITLDPWLFAPALASNKPTAFELPKPVAALSTLDLVAIKDSIDAAVKNGMSLEAASELYDPDNHLNLR